MKNTIKGTNSTLDYAEEWISDMEDKIVKITQLQQQREKKKMFKNKDSLRGLWNNITHTKIHIIEVPEGKKRERGAGEIITEKLPNLGNKIDIHV